MISKGYSVNDSYALLTKVLDRRKKYQAHALKDEDEVFDDFDSIFGKCIFIHGNDKENRPLLYIRYTAIIDLFRVRLFLSDSLERERFVRLRIQLFERAIELLDFNVEDGGADSVIEVSDLTGMSHTGIDLVVKEYQRLIIDYYACLVGRKIYISAQCSNFLWRLVAYPRLVPND